MDDARRPYVGKCTGGTWTALRTPLCGRGERVEVPVAEARKLAQACEDWIRAGNANGTGQARAAAFDLALHNADELLAIVVSGRLPRAVTFLASTKGKATERTYNPIGREASWKACKRPWGALVGAKGDRSSVSADQAARIEVLLDPDAEVTLPDGQTYSLRPLHEDAATPEERATAEQRAEAKRIRISEWMERKKAEESGEAPPPRIRPSRQTREKGSSSPQEAAAAPEAMDDRALVLATREKALQMLELCERYLSEWDGAVPF